MKKIIILLFVMICATALSSCGTTEIAATKNVSTHTTNHCCDWGNEIIIEEPTCDSDGKAESTCKICGKIKPILIPATGNHMYDDGVITEEATCIKDGIKTYTCSVCGETKTEIIEHEGHQLIDNACVKCGADIKSFIHLEYYERQENEHCHVEQYVVVRNANDFPVHVEIKFHSKVGAKMLGSIIDIEAYGETTINVGERQACRQSFNDGYWSEVTEVYQISSEQIINDYHESHN